MTLQQALAWLERYLSQERRDVHVRNQINRFVWSFLASTVASLTASGGHVTWSTLWALLPPAMWVAAEETWPSIPWSKVQEYLHAAATPPLVPPLPHSATAPQAGTPADAAPSAGDRPTNTNTNTEENSHG